ncbi:MAG: Holliday junction branch migration protein RuvA [Parcubacteria group bacterium]|jgi:Holliday junction DNA helicase RuvA
MIAKLTGKIEYLKSNYAVIDVHDIGYKVFLSAYTFGKVAGMSSGSALGGTEVSLFIHTYVREDTLALYGFLTSEELEMFELLISISGIGPKAGMGILSIATPKTIKTAILNEDPSILTKVSGIGKKTAERVILELRNKVADMTTGEKEEATIDSDAIEALLTMGYSVSEARDALKLVPLDVKDVGQRVKMALRNLGRK